MIQIETQKEKKKSRKKPKQSIQEIQKKYVFGVPKGKERETEMEEIFEEKNG